ncbi:MAG: type II toxin-antitoxin system prevent-host-death family antitoxin [Actinomycetia bacterium]|nr:type II toxin-antitoxin system prevent-host-death family antitoxin [Actinomycetes bacterium]
MSLPDQTEQLSQRELRNESGRLMRELAEGRSFILTNRGVPVGRVVPLGEPAPSLPITRPARRVGGWSALAVRREPRHPLPATLDELREERL